MTRETLALIMAGGRGSRLHNLTLYRSKPAVHFGGKYRLIDFTLSNCVNSGIRRVGVLTQYKSHSLIQHLQAGWSFLRRQANEFIELLPADQNPENDSWYAGTADAVYQNIECIRAHRPKYVLVLAGDHIYKMDYGPMLAHHAASGAQVTVGCIEVPLEEAHQFGVVAVDTDTRIHRFIEKPTMPDPMPGKPDRALVSMGIYVFDASYLLDQLSVDAQRSRSSHDFGHDILPAAIRNSRVYAYPFRDLGNPERPAYWRDVGTVDAFWSANLELTGISPELDLYDEQWPIWTRQEQVPPAKFVLDSQGERGIAVDSIVSGGCVVTGAQVHGSLMFTQSRVEPGSLIHKSLLLPGSVVGRRCEIRNAIIDAGCRIPDRMRIGVDSEFDSRFFHVSEGGVTVVTKEMLDAIAMSTARPQLSAVSAKPGEVLRPWPRDVSHMSAVN